jgi:hypothetical protein
MPADAPVQDRHSAMLAELAAMTLTLARELSNRALQAETVEDAVRLSTAFHRVSRGLRQTLALELKVIRFKDEAARDEAARDEAARDEQGSAAAARNEAAVLALQADMKARAAAVRREKVRRRIEGAAWSEHEAPDWWPEDGSRPPRPPRPGSDDPLWDRLANFLDQAQRRPDFLTCDFDILVVQACDAIGLDARLLYDVRHRRLEDTS